MRGQMQSFSSLDHCLPFKGDKLEEQEFRKGTMVSLQGNRNPGAERPVVPGFLGNILGGFSGSDDLSDFIPAAAKGPSPPLGSMMGGISKMPPRRSESQGLLHSGFSAMKEGASRVLDTASTMVNVTRASIPDNPLPTQNLLLFGVVAGMGVLSMFLAFLTLPLLVFAPSKFALLFTLGSLCFLAALALLRGINALAKHMVQQERLPFTAAYFSSLLLTLYATLLAKSYVLTLVFSIMQLCGLASFLVSYIPGGTQMLKFLGQAAWQAVRKAFNCRDSRELSLPI